LHDHPAQPGEYGNGHDRQQQGLRFFSHDAILVTPPPRGQSRRRSSPPRTRSPPDEVTGPTEYGVGRSGR
jgi:hypothetical protein